VIFGSTVTVLNLDNDEEQTYRIVGDDEADFKQNLISVNSPIARGLIGKEQDDVVTIRTLAVKWNTKLSRLNTCNSLLY
jgi:transcription elongation factor GreA